MSAMRSSVGTAWIGGGAARKAAATNEHRASVPGRDRGRPDHTLSALACEDQSAGTRSVIRIDPGKFGPPLHFRGNVPTESPTPGRGESFQLYALRRLEESTG